MPLAPRVRMTPAAEVNVAPPAEAVKSMPRIERSAASDGMLVVAALKIARSAVMLSDGTVPPQFDPVAKSVVPALFQVKSSAKADVVSRLKARMIEEPAKFRFARLKMRRLRVFMVFGWVFCGLGGLGFKNQSGKRFSGS